MSSAKSTNGKLDTTTKRALVEVVKAEFAMKREAIHLKNRDVESEATETVRKKLGFNLMKKKAENLIKQAEDIMKALEKMGFDENGNLLTKYDYNTRQYIPVQSDALKLIAGKGIKEGNLNQESEHSMVKKIWLTETIADAKKLVAKVCK